MISLISSNQSYLASTKKVQVAKFNYNLVSFTGNTQKALSYNQVVGDISADSSLFVERKEYKPKLPSVFLTDGVASINNIGITYESLPGSENVDKSIIELFPKTYKPQKVVIVNDFDSTAINKTRKIGVILSGGPAPGGHNVISGLYDALKSANTDSELYGFLNGPDGIIKGNYVELNNDTINDFRNTGGFNLIGTGRTKIETENQFEQTLETCKKLGLNGIVIIGGDDSNTNAAVLAEWLKQRGEDIQVIGCPKTIDGDLKSPTIETSFGFDSATKTYAQMVSNINQDAASARKYWHFIKLMGRSASNVTLEVALQAHPNITLISEEVQGKNMSLNDIAENIANVVAERAKNGKNYGTVLIPEGLIEFVPELNNLINDINVVTKDLGSDKNYRYAVCENKMEYIYDNLSETNRSIFAALRDTVLLEPMIEAAGDEKSILESLDKLDDAALKELIRKLDIETVKDLMLDANSDTHTVGRIGSLDSQTIKVRKLVKELGIEMKSLIEFLEYDDLYKYNIQQVTTNYVVNNLKSNNKKLFNSLTPDLKNALFAEKDPHGNIEVSKIKTEEFVISLVKAKLNEMNKKGKYNGKFTPTSHFLGYEGRCGFPTNFDTNYCYSLGYNAAALLNSGVTGYFSAIQNLDKPTSEWEAVGIPITSMMNIEVRHGTPKPVVKKALVDLKGNPFKFFNSRRTDWALNDRYRLVGPSQYFGPNQITDDPPMTLKLEKAV